MPRRDRTAGAVRVPDPGVGRAAAGAGELPEECRLELLRGDRRARDAAWPG